MSYDALKQRVYQANLQLVQYKLVTFTWGNVSEIDRQAGVFAIKPSGVDYDKLRVQDIVVLDLEGNLLDGVLRPSSDTKTHLELYLSFPNIGGIVHTHSPYAVAWAQAGRDIPCYGTTHADYFYGSIPCARSLTPNEVENDYEKNTGLTIIETFRKHKTDPMHVPAVVCRNHGPFAWGENAAQAVYHGVVLEEAAKMALFTEQLSEKDSFCPQYILDKHFSRKHGPNAYYGQLI